MRRLQLRFLLASVAILTCFSHANTSVAQQPAPYAKFINQEAQAVLLIRLAALTEHPVVKSLSEDAPELLEEMSTSFKDRFGLPMSSCQVFISGQLADATSKELEIDINQSFMVAVFDRPIDQQSVLSDYPTTPEWEKVDISGVSYFRPKQEPPAVGEPPDFENDPAWRNCVAFPADNVYVETSEAKIRTVLTGPSSDEWNNRLARVPADQLVTMMLGPKNISEGIAELSEDGSLPAGIAAHLPTMKKIQYAEIAFSFTGNDLLRVSLETANAEDAAEVQSSSTRLLEMGTNLAPLMLMNINSPEFGQVEKDSVMAMLKSITATSDGATAHVALPMPDKDTQEILLNLTANTLTVARSAAARAQQRSSMFEVGLAIHNFHDVYGKLPPGNDTTGRDANGRPLLSWRVHLLPFLEASDLYEKFHLDEPWDSPHNKELLSEMPAVFALSENLPEGMTDIVAPFGKNTPLGGDKSISFANVVDGTSNTALCFQISPEYAVPWTKPDDFQFDPEAEDAMALFKISGVDDINVLWIDASVSPLPATVSPQSIKAIIEINDRQPLSRDDIQ